MLEFEKITEDKYWLIDYTLTDAKANIENWRYGIQVYKTRGMYLCIYNLILTITILFFTKNIYFCIYPIICFICTMHLLIPSINLPVYNMAYGDIFNEETYNTIVSDYQFKHEIGLHIQEYVLPKHIKEHKIKANIFKICMILNFLYIPIIIKNIIIKLNK